MKKNTYGVGIDGQTLRRQVDVVRNYLESDPNNRVTQKFVTDKWGFTRLSAIIFVIKDDLEREGGNKEVCDCRLTVTNRFGNPTHPKEYWIQDVAE